MSKKYSFIINALILVLIIILVYVMMSYYAKGSVSIPTNQNDSNIPSGDTMKQDRDAIITITPTVVVSPEKKDEKINSINDDLTKSGDFIETSNNTLDLNSQPIEVEHQGNNELTSEVEPPQNELAVEEEKTNEMPGSIQFDQHSSPVIMTSENEISSKEKREILSELDNTLMELLEVVDKVQPVDESRLPQDSEVQEP